jgi:hypothetical protein
MTRMEYLTRSYCEVTQLRDRKLTQIRTATGDDSWMRRRNIPGNAIPLVAEWVGYCRMLVVLSADIERERQQPMPREMVLQ